MGCVLAACAASIDYHDGHHSDAAGHLGPSQGQLEWKRVHWHPARGPGARALGHFKFAFGVCHCALAGRLA